MSRWIKWGGGALAAVCCVLYFRELHNLLAGANFDAAPFLHLLPFALGAYVAAYLAAGMGWHMLLAIFEEGSRPMLSLGIFTASQFAKYLPGNIGHHAGRVYLGTRHGYSGYGVALSMVVELCTVVGAMLLLSLPLLGQWIGRLDPGQRFMHIGMAVVAAAIAGFIALKTAGGGRGRALLAGLRHRIQDAGSRRLAMARLLPAALLLVFLQILLTALSLGLLDSSGILLSTERLPAVIAVFSGAWLLGFLVPGAPAGLGVRELVLSEGLAPMTGHEAAVLLALHFRILSVLADLLAFVAGVAILALSGGRNEIRT